MQPITDKQLQELAHKRVDFRRHLVVFCVINTTLWLLRYLTGKGYMWPVWPLAGWGIGLIFHYLFEYRSSAFFSEEEEFNRLKKQMDRKEQEVH